MMGYMVCTSFFSPSFIRIPSPLDPQANPALGEEHVAAIQKKTADAIDDHGWLHSGDKGCKDKLGLVYITGRYKELIIGAGGENIAPVPIENLVKSNCPAISNIMMVGDKRKFNVALVTLKAEGATGEFAGNDNLIAPAKNAVAGVTTISEASNNEHYIKMIENAIVATNKLAVNNASKIQK
jgi:long-chain-fatty-acid--CoA ligase ACSBG